jgi:hypothetical protein
MLKAQFFHVNSQDKIPKLQEMLSQFFGKLDREAIVTVKTTEFGPSGGNEFYSYTVLVLYDETLAELGS